MDEVNDFVAILKELSKERFFNTGYDLLLNFRQDAIDAPTDPKIKVRTIDNMISFFEQKEEYEKCAYLIEVKKDILKIETVSK
jgi:hypothetical protein